MHSTVGIRRQAGLKHQSTTTAFSCHRAKVHSRAISTVVERDAVTSIHAAVEPLGGFFAPQLTEDPAALLLHEVPFLTKAAGALPVQPRNLNHALYNYGRYGAECNIVLPSKQVPTWVTANVRASKKSWM